MSRVFAKKINILFRFFINCSYGGDHLKKIKLGVGVLLMLGAMLVSDSAGVLFVYVIAAFLHEIGHLAAAKMLKVGIKEIRFGFSGVRIVVDDRLTSYKGELLLSLAGPFVNIAVFVAVALFFTIKEGEINGLFVSAGDFMAMQGRGRLGAVGFLALASLIQAILNLLPINTFDGGRVLYCALSELASERVAERIIDITTALSAFILWTLALYLMLRVSNGLGIFVFAACIFAGGLRAAD